MERITRGRVIVKIEGNRKVYLRENDEFEEKEIEISHNESDAAYDEQSVEYEANESEEIAPDATEIEVANESGEIEPQTEAEPIENADAQSVERADDDIENLAAAIEAMNIDVDNLVAKAAAIGIELQDEVETIENSDVGHVDNENINEIGNDAVGNNAVVEPPNGKYILKNMFCCRCV